MKAVGSTIFHEDGRVVAFLAQREHCGREGWFAGESLDERTHKAVQAAIWRANGVPPASELLRDINKLLDEAAPP